MLFKILSRLIRTNLGINARNEKSVDDNSNRNVGLSLTVNDGYADLEVVSIINSLSDPESNVYVEKLEIIR